MVDVAKQIYYMDKFLQTLLEHSDIIIGCWNFFVTIVGAAITQLLSLKIGTVGVIPFLKMWCPKKSKNWYMRANCVLLVIIGATMSYIILEPDTMKTSLCAGLTWCGTLQSLGLTANTDSND